LTSQPPSPSAVAGDPKIIPTATGLTDAWSSPKSDRREITNKSKS
jgi:hypothetical protein